ncbi:MAG: DUF465 domain-containing protein [Thermodesulfobacteriota bacterium]|jgi:uncharacterized protein YdcH (DUF465 family)|nr:MAG: DUF465 domain-containing protein [Thermodesulfobacteriota bacterium]
MEKYDEELISQWIDKDTELKQHVEEHREFERKLEELEKRTFLTTEEETERKNLKKLKLRGKDRIEAILCKYRIKGTAL